LLEKVCKGGEVEVVNNHALILLHAAVGSQFVGLFVLINACANQCGEQPPNEMIHGKSAKNESSIELYIQGRAFIGESILF
jgi:hypothetical protein